tara:strand:+ start:1102 stop:1314 length:213 start_codon:yes stop_codon:yes gene_type:complete
MSKLLKKVLIKNFITHLQKIHEDNELMIKKIQKILINKKCEELEIMLFDLLDENADIDELLDSNCILIID